jgi:hypothetical protein
MSLTWLMDRFGIDPAFGSGSLATVLQGLFSILITLHGRALDKLTAWPIKRVRFGAASPSLKPRWPGSASSWALVFTL